MNRNEAINVWLEYPRLPDKKKYIRVGLEDVRAADGLTISYDFVRDGWKIEREELIDHDTCFECTGIWTEVAFIPAWTIKNEIKP